MNQPEVGKHTSKSNIFDPRERKSARRHSQVCRLLHLLGGLEEPVLLPLLEPSRRGHISGHRNHRSNQEAHSSRRQEELLFLGPLLASPRLRISHATRRDLADRSRKGLRNPRNGKAAIADCARVSFGPSLLPGEEGEAWEGEGSELLLPARLLLRGVVWVCFFLVVPSHLCFFFFPTRYQLSLPSFYHNAIFIFKYSILFFMLILNLD